MQDNVSNTETLNQKLKDRDRVGLSEAGRYALDQLVTDGHFKDHISGYRFAIASAILAKVDASSHEVIWPSGHMYLVSQLDPDGVLCTTVEHLYPEYASIKVRHLERLADLGVQKLVDEVGAGKGLLYWEK